MDKSTEERLRRVWNQRDIPVLLHRGKGNRPRMRVPKDASNISWVRKNRHTIPKWDIDKKYWEVPQSWFNLLVRECIDTFGKVYIIQPYRAQTKCAPACWHATGDVCECSCMGEHHGMENPDGNWKIVSDTFATHWGDQEVACRLIERKI